MPVLHVIAGPNGCGKSTLTRTSKFLTTDVIDPDAIARDMNASNPVTAGREALRRRRSAVDVCRSHLIETTLSGQTVLHHMRDARRKGYRVELHYVSVASPEQALNRIRNRVNLGGHGIPEIDVRRRFFRSHANLPLAISEADETYFYDNADPDSPYRIVGEIIRRVWRIHPDAPEWVVSAQHRTNSIA